MSDFTVVSFISSLAQAKAALSQVHIFMEKSGEFYSVDSSVIPFVIGVEGGRERRVSLSLYVNGELKKWNDENKRAFGVLLAARYDNNGWTLDGEFGWSGRDIGWDAVYSFEISFDSFDDLSSELVDSARRLSEDSIAYIRDGLNNSPDERQ